MTRNYSKEMTDDLGELIEVESIITVDGNEGLLSDIFTSVSNSALSGAKIAGGKAMDGLVSLFKKCNRSIALAYGSHKTQFEMISKGMAKDEEGKEVTFSKTLLAKLTTNGETDDIEHALKNLIDVLRILDKHRLELEAFYQKENAIFSEYSSIKSTDDAVKVIKKLDDLKYPMFDLGHKDHSMSISVTLPGGKHFAFDSEKLDYKLGTEDINGKESDDMYTKDQVKRLLRQLDDLDDIYGVVKKANENYIRYLEKFNTVVKGAFVYVDDLKGKVSVSLIRDLQSRLEGNTHVFSFYSGFLPKVLTYVDDYIDVMSGHLSKQFN